MSQAPVLAPNRELDQPHSIHFATENIVEGVFHPLGPHHGHIETSDLKEAGERLRLLGKSLSDAEFWRTLRLDDLS